MKIVTVIPRLKRDTGFKMADECCCWCWVQSIFAIELRAALTFDNATSRLTVDAIRIATG